MKLENYCKKYLYEGQKINSYRALCKLLNQPEKKDNSRIKQLEDFRDYFNYERDGNAFIIKEVYKRRLSEQEAIDAKKKYADRIRSILLSYLAGKDQDVVYMTTAEIIQICGLVNKLYYQKRSDKKSLLELDEEMTLFPINDFFTRSEDKNRMIVYHALESLSRKQLISYGSTYIINHEGFTKNEFIEADEWEIKTILDIKREALDELGLDEERDLNYHENLRQQYYKMIDQRYHERGWFSVCKTYKIICNNKGLINKVNIDKLALEVNAIVLEALNKQADDRFAKNPPIEHHGVGIKQRFAYFENYPKLQRVLSEELIKIKEETNG